MNQIKSSIKLMASLLKPLAICLDTLEENIQSIQHAVEGQLSSSGKLNILTISLNEFTRTQFFF